MRSLLRPSQVAERGAALTGYALVLAAFTAVSLGAIEGLNNASTAYLDETSQDIAQSRELAFYDDLEELEDPDGDGGDTDEDPDGEPVFELADGGQFQSPADGLCMTLEGDNKFRQRACDGSAAQQISVYTNDATGSSQLRIGGQCIGLSGNSPNNGDQYEVQDCDTDNPMQLFRRNDVTEQWESATNRSPLKCLDISGGGGEGHVIHQWDCHGGANQIWPDPAPYVPPVTTPPDPVITGAGVFEGAIPDGTDFSPDGAFEDNDNVFVFTESVVELTSDLSVGATVIPAGTTVCSYIMWYDPVTNNEVNVTIDFGAPVLAGAGSTSELQDTSQFEAPGVDYQSYDRPWETDDGFNAVGNTLQVDPYAVAGNADMLRVFVDCSA